MYECTSEIGLFVCLYAVVVFTQVHLITKRLNKQIIANYAYAQRLDDNWSRQTRGQGIVKPFTTWWVTQIKRIAGLK